MDNLMLEFQKLIKKMCEYFQYFLIAVRKT